MAQKAIEQQEKKEHNTRKGPKDVSGKGRTALANVCRCWWWCWWWVLSRVLFLTGDSMIQFKNLTQQCNCVCARTFDKFDFMHTYRACFDCIVRAELIRAGATENRLSQLWPRMYLCTQTKYVHFLKHLLILSDRIHRKKLKKTKCMQKSNNELSQTKRNAEKTQAQYTHLQPYRLAYPQMCTINRSSE